MAIKSKIKRCNAEFNQTRQCNTSCLYYETPLHLYAFAFLGCIVLFSQNRGICLEALASLVNRSEGFGGKKVEVKVDLAGKIELLRSEEEVKREEWIPGLPSEYVRRGLNQFCGVGSR